VTQASTSGTAATPGARGSLRRGSKEHREAEKEHRTLDKKIHSLGDRIATLDEGLLAADHDDFENLARLASQRDSLRDELETLESRWLELSELLG